ncbi:MAG: elongation factor P [Alphaproteobacteria bacterium]|nr:elongation factor P [Alphaproteobacteria bacterium]
MKISGVEVRPGMVLEHQNRLWVAIKIMHTKPGKGGAYMQVELKDLRDGTKLNERFRSAESVERVRLDDHDYQYLYGEDTSLTFMDSETFEQITIPRELVGDQAVFLQDGMTVTISSYEDSPISVELPETVVCDIEETDAVVKGQTAASSYKPARLSNGVRVMVPPHISSGDRIVVSTADSSYRERAKA